MNQGRSSQSIADAWRRLLDLGQEIGESPIFTLDALGGGLSGANAILALTLLDAERRDLTTPAFLVGGVSPLWLAALWREPSPTMPRRTAPTVVIYTAPDAATHCVACAVWDARLSPFFRRPGALPAWAQIEAGPAANPGAPERWEVAPLSRFTTTQGRDGWLAWAGVVLALVLLLVAPLI
ncbi:MAG: hypothetical protein NZ553_18940 [Caldilinea sp.]|nr:hypothetical protein [Caldilinea sp.]MDW8442557.1 hypothetical protein [Caldilineaceae bacterium]